MLGCEAMALGYIEPLENVISFINEMKSIICRDDFIAKTDFLIIRSSTPGTTGHKNTMTLTSLKLNEMDVINVLKALTEHNYCETVPDLQYPTGPPFYIFNTTVNKKDIYIKINILTHNNKRVFTLAFHFAEYKMDKPYQDWKK